MLTNTTLRTGCCAIILSSLVFVGGCGSSNSDAAYYAGDEEATREHMKEVESEERIHARETGAVQSAPQGNTVADEERAQMQRGI